MSKLLVFERRRSLRGLGVSWKPGLLEPWTIGSAFEGRLSLPEWFGGRRWMARVLNPVDMGCLLLVLLLDFMDERVQIFRYTTLKGAQGDGLEILGIDTVDMLY